MIAIYRGTSFAAVTALLVFVGQSSVAALSDCHEATCRITAADGGRGSGCAFGRADGAVYVLTNAHVASSNTLEVEFWRNGHKSRPLSGRLVARDKDADAAVVAVAESQFAGVLPGIIPIAARDCSPRPGDSVMSVGCAGGSWSTGWKGHVLGYSGADMYFVPPPANGRSGSAIFDAEGEKIIGLLKARSGDDSTGIASSLPSLYRAFSAEFGNSSDWRSTTNDATDTKDAQCPDGDCPSPWRLLPYRHRQDERIEQLHNQRQQVWPTLPPNSQSLDLGPTNQKLDRIADLLLQMRAEGNSQPVPQALPDDREVERKVDIAVEQATAESRQATAEIKQATGKMSEVIGKLIGDRETLKQRFDERIEKVKNELGEDATRRDVARAYVKDLAEEKLAQGTLAFSGGKILTGALGVSAPLSLAIGMGLWFLSRRAAGKLESGDPLLVQRMFDRIGDKVDSLKDRLADRSVEAANERRAPE